jgi:RHS repeat-associated protein
MWGNLVYRAGNTRQPFTWNGAYGYEWVPETGLYHVGAREHDPCTARWLQRDPIDAASGDPNLNRLQGMICIGRNVDISNADGLISRARNVLRTAIRRYGGTI